MKDCLAAELEDEDEEEEDGSRPLPLPSGKAEECLRFSTPELLTPQTYAGTDCRKPAGAEKGTEGGRERNRGERERRK